MTTRDITTKWINRAVREPDPTAADLWRLQAENKRLREALEDIAAGRGMTGNAEVDVRWALMHATEALASPAPTPAVPAEVRKALTEEDYASIVEEAAASLRQAAKGVQGQVVRPADSLEWHVMQVTWQRALAGLDATAGGGDG